MKYRVLAVVAYIVEADSEGGADVAWTNPECSKIMYYGSTVDIRPATLSEMDQECVKAWEKVLTTTICARCGLPYADHSCR